MYIKVISTGEIFLCQSTMSSDNGWYFESPTGYIHESEVIACRTKV